MYDDDKPKAPSEKLGNVLREALKAVSAHEGPTAREALQFSIRMECARLGLPKPDFDCFPPEDVVNQVLG